MRKALASYGEREKAKFQLLFYIFVKKQDPHHKV